MPENRFKILEDSNGYTVVDCVTGAHHWLGAMADICDNLDWIGDGFDVVGELEIELNANLTDTLLAYFGDTGE